METVKLNNGIHMPKLSYGVFQIASEECERCVLDAIRVGYRSIDTAQVYNNEEAVGNAIIKCGIPREELFITTKVWVSNAGEAKATASINESMHKLKSDYIDLLLVHQPFADYYGTYRAMETAYREGKVRAIGVSNFLPDRFIDLTENVAIKPVVNQMETHVFNQQKNLQKIMSEYGAQLESWGPFAEGKNNFFTNKTLQKIGKQYGKTVAQTALRFLIQCNVVVIPKSTHKERMIENLNVFDFSLSHQDMQAITSLNQHKTLFMSPDDSEMVRFILNLEKNNNL